MKTLAAILVETGRPLVVAEIGIPPLKPGQTLVEIAYSGVCHTQILEARGLRGPDPYLPHCLGHEGSGIVREVGPDVTKVKPGDRVILSWMKGRGRDVPGTVYSWDGKPVNAGAITTFGHHAVISENRLTVLPDAIELRRAAMLGCAIPTGLGVIFNTAKAEAGRSVVVFGTGGIGLCAIAGARIAGCSPIAAVDVHAKKLELAKQFGAAHVIDASSDDVEAALKAAAPGGFDFAVEATGDPTIMARALECVRPQGGTAVVVGNARFGEKIAIDPRHFNMGKRLLGTWGGDNLPDRDFPRYIEWLLSGRLALEPLLESRDYSIERINDALEDLSAGRVARPLIALGGR